MKGLPNHHAKLLLVLTVTLLLPMLLTACGEEEDVVRVDMSRREMVRVPNPEPAITYAYLPQYSHTVSYRRHNPLIQYLSRETGLAFRQVFPDTFEEHRRLVEQGDIDISFSNPVTYVELARSGARAFARIIEPSGKPTFQGQIIARSDNRIRSIKDCKGARWIAVDPLSAGGYLFALGLFLDNGIRPDDFTEIAFAPGPGGKQEKAVLAMFAGKYDIASIRQGTLEVVKDKINLDAISILATTREYPSWVYAARKGLEPDTITRIADALFALNMDNPDHAPILKGAGMRGIIPANDNDYNTIRELMEKVRPDLDNAATMMRKDSSAHPEHISALSLTGATAAHVEAAR